MVSFTKRAFFRVDVSIDFTRSVHLYAHTWINYSPSAAWNPWNFRRPGVFFDPRRRTNVPDKDVYRILKGYCPICGEEVVVNQLQDINIELFDKAVRRQDGLITKNEIENLLERYDIGKEPLDEHRFLG